MQGLKCFFSCTSLLEVLTRIIASLSDFIKDEAKSVKMYAKMATKYKAGNKEIADVLQYGKYRDDAS